METQKLSGRLTYDSGRGIISTVNEKIITLERISGVSWLQALLDLASGWYPRDLGPAWVETVKGLWLPSPSIKGREQTCLMQDCSIIIRGNCPNRGKGITRIWDGGIKEEKMHLDLIPRALLFSPLHCHWIPGYCSTHQHLKFQGWFSSAKGFHQ